MTRYDNRLPFPGQPDSRAVCLEFCHLKMKPEAKEKLRIERQINSGGGTGEGRGSTGGGGRREQGGGEGAALQAIKITVICARCVCLGCSCSYNLSIKLPALFSPLFSLFQISGGVGGDIKKALKSTFWGTHLYKRWLCSFAPSSAPSSTLHEGGDATLISG